MTTLWERAMTADWKVNDDGDLDLPVLTTFSIAQLPGAMLVVQLRCAPGDVPVSGTFRSE
jgi:hypothetical protein